MKPQLGNSTDSAVTHTEKIICVYKSCVFGLPDTTVKSDVKNVN